MDNIIQIAFGDYAHELKETRRLLQAVPTDQLAFKPHEKSYSLGGLAQHVAQIPYLFYVTASLDEWDFAAAEKVPPLNTTAEIVTLFDNTSKQALAALADLRADALDRPWTFRVGSHVVFTSPKGTTLRSFAISHMIHHRAQLTVYLRLLDSKVPGMYGPTADER